MSIKRQKKKIAQCDFWTQYLHWKVYECSHLLGISSSIYRLSLGGWWIDVPRKHGPKNISAFTSNLHCPICNAQNHFTKFTLLLCNKNSERMLVSKLIHKADTWNFNFHNRSHQNKMWEIKNTLSVYSESHTSYHYSSIYYIEIIQVLYC